MTEAPALTSDPIRRVLIVGGGIVGWSAAAALRRRLPWLDVAILPHPVGPDALADGMVSTLPSIMGFHADLGLSDEDAVMRTGAGLRLGTLFADWARDPAEYMHAYGPHGFAVGAQSFHLHWARLAAQGSAVPFDRHSPAAALARAGRLVPAQDPTGGLFGDLEMALQLDLPRYRAMLQAFSRHCGVREIGGSFRGVERTTDGSIAAVMSSGGERCEAELYIDATGPAALLQDPEARSWEDWSGMLLCDRIMQVEAPPPVEAALHDAVTAMPAGWRWKNATAARTTHGICYSSAHCDDASASRYLSEASGIAAVHEPAIIAAGTRPSAWQRNCVALGDAATAIEPLEWSNLHLAHSAIDRIIEMLPGADCAAIELAEYNRQTYAEAVRVRDFVLLHYVTSQRDEPFWREAAAVTLPPTLAHTLRLFRERGRLPVHEEETFARDSWLAVLFGQGVMPLRIDPLLDVVPIAEVVQAMAQMRGRIDAAIPDFPTHAAFCAAQSRLLAR